MATDQSGRIEVLCRQLTDCVMNAALCAKAIVGIVHELNDDKGPSGPDDRRGDDSSLRPLVDEATLSVVWKGKILHLGYTQGFRLLARLARSVNRYVTHLDLLQEIWDNEFADTAALRAGVQRLRVKLRCAGMADLADSIIGHRGRYILSLKKPPRHSDVMALSD